MVPKRGEETSRHCERTREAIPSYKGVARFQRRTTAPFFLFLILISTPLWAQPPPPIQFEKHIIDPNFPNGYQVSVADINGDGKPDILALATDPAALVWYRNPDWQKFNITTQTRQNIDLAPYDINNDGRPDIALASEFHLEDATSGGKIEWLECPKDPTTNQEWPRHYIGAIPTAHRLRWVDFTGDGIGQLVVVPIIGRDSKRPYNAGEGIFLSMFSHPKNLNNESWPQIVIDTTLHLAHGVAVVHVPDVLDRKEKLFIASAEGVAGYSVVDSPIGTVLSAGNLTKHSLVHFGSDSSPHGCSEVALGTTENNSEKVPSRLFITTIEPWHGNEVVVYNTASDAKDWTRTVVDSTFNDGHGLLTADLDADGTDEIIAGYRGGSHGLFAYKYDFPANTWNRFPIDLGGVAVAGLFIADINQDGKPDIIATGTSTHNVVWYENKT